MSRAGREAAVSPTQPHLVVLLDCDDPVAPSSRHLLGEIDEVWFGRGPRLIERLVHDGRKVLRLRLPDVRMSTAHGRLIRGPLGWVFDDPLSKNGTIVDGELTRNAIVAAGSLLELGHSFLAFCDAVVERGAALDMLERDIPAPSPRLASFVGSLADDFAALARIAATGISVLLRGETGTGKEIAARALHAMSGRTGPFVAVNCGALPQSLLEAELFGYRRGAFTGAASDRVGLIRSADGGTLFLDEVGELALSSQAALLRVLQEREVVPIGADRPVTVDIRLCAATHRDLRARVAQGQFREDLYARLSGFNLELPALRARRADFGIVLRGLLATMPGGGDTRFSSSAMRALLAHDWPLNIRELEKVVSVAAALTAGNAIQPADLRELRISGDSTATATPADRPGPATARAPDDPDHDDRLLRERLVSLLTVHHGNVSTVSRILGAGRGQFYRWVQRFGIDLAGFRGPARRADRGTSSTPDR